MGKPDINPNQLNMFQSIEEQTRKPANTSMVHYGVQNEQSDWRIHVGWSTQHVISFPTASGRKIIEAKVTAQNANGITYSHDGMKEVKTNGIPTAVGYPVPISQIEGVSQILIPLDIHRKYAGADMSSTSSKGKIAVAVVLDMLKRFLIPLPLTYSEVDDKALQIKGQDIIVNSNLRIQVKMDMRAGPTSNGGTGNIYLQVGECNPYKWY